MIPDEQDVLASMEEYWWTINACEPKESSVIKKRSEFNSRLRGLENKYLSDLTLHFPKSIRNKATDYRDQYVNGRCGRPRETSPHRNGRQVYGYLSARPENAFLPWPDQYQRRNRDYKPATKHRENKIRIKVLIISTISN